MLFFKMEILNLIENIYFEIVKLYKEFILKVPDGQHWLDVAAKMMESCSNLLLIILNMIGKSGRLQVSLSLSSLVL